MSDRSAFEVPVETPRSRRVVCAALRDRVSGVTVIGARHFDALMVDQIESRGMAGWVIDWVQGFIDQHGVFMDRTESWIVAATAGQINRRVGGDSMDGGTLYSENLY